MKYFIAVIFLSAGVFFASAKAQTVTQLDDLVMADLDACSQSSIIRSIKTT